MQRNMWLHLLSSLWEIRLRCDLFRKKIDQKKLVCEIFFALNYLWYRRRSDVFIVNFEHISHLFLVFQLLALAN